MGPKKRRTSKVFSGRWNEKSLYLLRKTGYLDARSDTKVKDKSKNINKLVNYAVQDYLSKNPSKGNPDEALYENLYLQQVKEQRAVIRQAEEKIMVTVDKIRLLRKENEKKISKEAEAIITA